MSKAKYIPNLSVRENESRTGLEHYLEDDEGQVVAVVGPQKGLAEEIAKRINAHDDLVAACDAWMQVESEMADKHPCPDLALRAAYRKRAVTLTEVALAKETRP